MDTLFIPNNTHWLDPESFDATDPNLIALKEQYLIHENNLLQQLPLVIPGIYTLEGSFQ